MVGRWWQGRLAASGAAAGMLVAGLMGTAAPGVAAASSGRALAGQFDYVAMGDSYSSGEGSPPFVTGTAGGGDNCHRSRTKAWPSLVAGVDTQFNLLANIACSGAVTADIDQTGFQNELEQDMQLANLNMRPGGLITVTIGGNDMQFTDLVTDCYHHDCATDGHLAAFNANVDNNLPGLLTRTYHDIASSAPAGTRLLVVGYPNIFTTATAPVNCAWLTPDEQQGLMDAATNLDRVVQSTAVNAGFGYVSTLNVMAGHEMCTADPWLVPINPALYPIKYWRQQFGHPRPAGQAAIAGAVENYLAQPTTIEVPGTAALNVDGYAEVSSMSCTSPGYCSAGGFYESGSGQEPFVADETGGTWGDAIEVPGITALNTRGEAAIESLSCASPGYCSAGGYFEDTGSAGYVQEEPFVVNETGGTWGDAGEVPGITVLNTGGAAQVTAISCGGRGDCAAIGSYFDATGTQPFAVTETGGNWGVAGGFSGGALGPRFAAFNGAPVSVSCTDNGCPVGGDFTDSSGIPHAYISGAVDLQAIPGITAFTSTGEDFFDAVSCSTAANGGCTALGTYETASLGVGTWVINGSGGAWSNATQIPGFFPGRSLSCTPDGGCTAGGFFYDTSGHQQPYVTSLVNGTWANAIELPGITALDNERKAAITSLSCASAGNCTAGGYYQDAAGGNQAFVANQIGGVWDNAIELPGWAALTTGTTGTPTGLTTVSCAPPGYCAAAGTYADSAGAHQAFVTAGNLTNAS